MGYGIGSHNRDRCCAVAVVSILCWSYECYSTQIFFQSLLHTHCRGPLILNASYDHLTLPWQPPAKSFTSLVTQNTGQHYIENSLPHVQALVPLTGVRYFFLGHTLSSGSVDIYKYPPRLKPRGLFLPSDLHKPLQVLNYDTRVKIPPELSGLWQESFTRVTPSVERCFNYIG